MTEGDISFFEWLVAIGLLVAASYIAWLRDRAYWAERMIEGIKSEHHDLAQKVHELNYIVRIMNHHLPEPIVFGDYDDEYFKTFSDD